MNKKQLLPILLLTGVFGLVGCSQTSIDLTEIEDLDLVSNSYANSICVDANANLINVIKIKGTYEYVSDYRSVKPYDSYYEEYHDSYVYHIYDNQVVEKGKYSQQSISENGNEQLFSVDYDESWWYATCQDETTPDVLSLYNTSAEKFGTGYTSSDSSIKESSFSDSEDISYDWAMYRAELVANSMNSSVALDTDYTYGLSDNMLIGYSLNVSTSTNNSPFAPNDSSKKVTYKNVTGNISRYVKNKTFGWVLDSSVRYNREYMLTDNFGNTLEEELLVDSEVYTSSYVYGALVSGKDKFTYEESLSDSLFIKTFDTTTYAATNSYQFSNVTESVKEMGNPSYANHLYRNYLTLNAGSLVALTDQISVDLTSSIDEKWGWNSLTETPEEKYIVDGEIDNHDFIKILVTGTYSISCELNETYDAVETFTIRYIHK